jgi:hypothetical protein
MSEITDRAPDTVSRTVDHELSLIREAVAMVATGTSPRVVIASLHFSDALLGEARLLAAGAGVHVVPLWGLDEARYAIAIEPGIA